MNLGRCVDFVNAFPSFHSFVPHPSCYFNVSGPHHHETQVHYIGSTDVLRSRDGLISHLATGPCGGPGVHWTVPSLHDTPTSDGGGFCVWRKGKTSCCISYNGYLPVGMLLPRVTSAPRPSPRYPPGSSMGCNRNVVFSRGFWTILFSWMDNSIPVPQFYKMVKTNCRKNLLHCSFL